MRYILPLLILAGSIAKADDPVARKETYTEAVARFEASVASVNATVGNYNAELGSVKEELKCVKAEVADLTAAVDEVRKLLIADKPINVQVPEPPAEPTLAPPVKADAPPKDADRHTAGIKFHGKPIDVVEWLATPLTTETRIGIGTRDTGNRAMILTHLKSHGLEGDFSKYSREQLITIHSVAHLKDDLKPSKSIVIAPKKVVTSSTVVTFPQASGGCPNGRCPLQTSYYRSRRR